MIVAFPAPASIPHPSEHRRFTVPLLPSGPGGFPVIKAPLPPFGGRYATPNPGGQDFNSCRTGLLPFPLPPPAVALHLDFR